MRLETFRPHSFNTKYNETESLPIHPCSPIGTGRNADLGAKPDHYRDI